MSFLSAYLNRTVFLSKDRKNFALKIFCRPNTKFRKGVGQMRSYRTQVHAVRFSGSATTGNRIASAQIVPRSRAYKASLKGSALRSYRTQRMMLIRVDTNDLGGAKSYYAPQQTSSMVRRLLPKPYDRGSLRFTQ